MSVSDEWTDWHLTPRGWEMGSVRVESGASTNRTVPADRVLTYRYSEYAQSIYAKIQRDYKLTWEADDKEAVRDLRAKHGELDKGIGQL